MLISTVETVMSHVSEASNLSETSNSKITIVGAGSIGTSIAYSLLMQKTTSELVLVDKDEILARGEMLDMQNAIIYLDSPRISCSSDYQSSKNSSICIITAGAGIGENKIKLVNRNTEIFREIIPQLVRYNPDAILIVVTNPVDILTYVAWKLSGFPSYRVIGCGTVLQSARFRYLLAQKLGVSTSSLHAFVIGENGEHSVPVWSGITVSGVRLRDVNYQLGTEEDPEDWTEIHKQVVQSETEVEQLKSFGSWGIASSISRIVKAILEDSKDCFPISTHVKGCRHGVNKDVFLSLPCVLGRQGVCYIIKQSLSEKEKNLLQESADSMNKLQKTLNL